MCSCGPHSPNLRQNCKSVAYPEGARPAIADARTRHILASMETLWHRWSVRVPATIINRLYPRAVGGGCPDLIESALGGAGQGQEFWLSKLPWLVLTGSLAIF